MRADLDYAQVNALLSYDQETGGLFWKKRPVEFFKGGSIGDEAAARRWNNRYAGKPAFTANDGDGYRVGGIFSRLYHAHRIAWLLHTGVWPTVIDHINGDTSDNRICNLRDVTRAENQKNMKRSSRNTSGICGVYWHKQTQKWAAEIKPNKTKIHLGLFDSFETAVSARAAANAEYGFSERHGS